MSVVRCVLRRGKRAQFPEYDRVVGMAALEEAHEVAYEFVVFRLRFDQSEFRPHESLIFPIKQRLIGLKACFQRLFFRQRQQGLSQAAQIPKSNVRLLIEGIAAVVIRVVADEPGVVVVHEAVRSIVQCQAHDRHIVGVHDTVRPADGLPLSDQLCGALNDFDEEPGVLVPIIMKMWEMMLDHVVSQRFQMLMLLSIIEDFERAEADMGRRHPDHHRAGFDLLAVDLVVAAHQAQRLRGRDTESLHRCAAKILADRRAQHRPAVSITRERRHPRTFQMQVPPLPPVVRRLTEENGASIAELRDIDPELMPGVQHGQRLHTWRQHVPAKERRELRPDKLFRIEINQLSCYRVCMNQIGRGAERRRVQSCIKDAGKAGIGIVEREGFESTTCHGFLYHERLAFCY